VSIWKDLREEQKSTTPTSIQSIHSQQGEHVYNAPGGIINIVQKGAEESKSTTVSPAPSNFKQYLRVTIDSDSDLENYEEYVTIDNCYDDEEIQNMYAILNSVKIIEFYD
ncbi:hypothetical protein JZU68_06175, partial [bacterium]|nr:hypothetical protein [bacterium]